VPVPARVSLFPGRQPGNASFGARIADFPDGGHGLVARSDILAAYRPEQGMRVWSNDCFSSASSAFRHISIVVPYEQVPLGVEVRSIVRPAYDRSEACQRRSSRRPARLIAPKSARPRNDASSTAAKTRSR
jgi:hypothetical protein